ncbi:Hypothetical_protein [Hexamita inflata]|uniref:Hypothetical_protein n=2 Tax=Hexamita inflata TaxID=28002 RepID=A0AA86NIP8_9EUKA|nr:Hypothetical protein HINF_LOCUS7418 [Hexamita inflata]
MKHFIQVYAKPQTTTLRLHLQKSMEINISSTESALFDFLSCLKSPINLEYDSYADKLLNCSNLIHDNILQLVKRLTVMQLQIQNNQLIINLPFSVPIIQICKCDPISLAETILSLQIKENIQFIDQINADNESSILLSKMAKNKNEKCQNATLLLKLITQNSILSQKRIEKIILQKSKKYPIIIRWTFYNDYSCAKIKFDLNENGFQQAIALESPQVELDAKLFSFFENLKQSSNPILNNAWEHIKRNASLKSYTQQYIDSDLDEFEKYFETREILGIKSDDTSSSITISVKMINDKIVFQSNPVQEISYNQTILLKTIEKYCICYQQVMLQVDHSVRLMLEGAFVGKMTAKRCRAKDENQNEIIFSNSKNWKMQEESNQRDLNYIKDQIACLYQIQNKNNQIDIIKEQISEKGARIELNCCYKYQKLRIFAQQYNIIEIPVDQNKLKDVILQISKQYEFVTLRIDAMIQNMMRNLTFKKGELNNCTVTYKNSRIPLRLEKEEKQPDIAQEVVDLTDDKPIVLFSANQQEKQPDVQQPQIRTEPVDLKKYRSQYTITGSSYNVTFMNEFGQIVATLPTGQTKSFKDVLSIQEFLIDVALDSRVKDLVVRSDNKSGQLILQIQPDTTLVKKLLLYVNQKIINMLEPFTLKNLKILFEKSYVKIESKLKGAELWQSVTEQQKPTRKQLKDAGAVFKDSVSADYFDMFGIAADTAALSTYLGDKQFVTIQCDLVLLLADYFAISRMNKKTFKIMNPINLDQIKHLLPPNCEPAMNDDIIALFVHKIELIHQKTYCLQHAVQMVIKNIPKDQEQFENIGLVTINAIQKMIGPHAMNEAYREQIREYLKESNINMIPNAHINNVFGQAIEITDLLPFYIQKQKFNYEQLNSIKTQCMMGILNEHIIKFANEYTSQLIGTYLTKNYKTLDPQYISNGVLQYLTEKNNLNADNLIQYGLITLEQLVKLLLDKYQLPTEIIRNLLSANLKSFDLDVTTAMGVKLNIKNVCTHVLRDSQSITYSDKFKSTQQLEIDQFMQFIKQNYVIKRHSYKNLDYLYFQLAEKSGKILTRPLLEQLGAVTLNNIRAHYKQTLIQDNQVYAPKQFTKLIKEFIQQNNMSVQTVKIGAVSLHHVFAELFEVNNVPDFTNLFQDYTSQFTQLFIKCRYIPVQITTNELYVELARHFRISLQSATKQQLSLVNIDTVTDMFNLSFKSWEEYQEFASQFKSFLTKMMVKFDPVDCSLYNVITCDLNPKIFEKYQSVNYKSHIDSFLKPMKVIKGEKQEMYGLLQKYIQNSYQRLKVNQFNESDFPAITGMHTKAQFVEKLQVKQYDQQYYFFKQLEQSLQKLEVKLYTVFFKLGLKWYGVNVYPLVDEALIIKK